MGNSGPTPSYRRSVLVGIVVAAITTGTAGCGGGPESVTCDDYASKDLFERNGAVMDLLEAHQLDQLSLNYVKRAGTAIDSYCGTQYADPEGGDTAERNNSSSIDDAVDWGSFSPL